MENIYCISVFYKWKHVFAQTAPPEYTNTKAKQLVNDNYPDTYGMLSLAIIYETLNKCQGSCLNHTTKTQAKVVQ